MFFSNEEEQEFWKLLTPVWKVQVQGLTVPAKTHACSSYDIILEINKLYIYV